MPEPRSLEPGAFVRAPGTWFLVRPGSLVHWSRADGGEKGPSSNERTKDEGRTRHQAPGHRGRERYTDQKSALVLALPVLLLVPRLRLLSYWAAGVWGVAVALAIALLVGWGEISPIFAAWMGTLGAVAGVTSAMAARLLLRSQTR